MAITIKEFTSDESDSDCVDHLPVLLRETMLLLHYQRLVAATNQKKPQDSLSVHDIATQKGINPTTIETTQGPKTLYIDNISSSERYFDAMIYGDREIAIALRGDLTTLPRVIKDKNTIFIQFSEDIRFATCMFNSAKVSNEFLLAFSKICKQENVNLLQKK